MIVYSVKYPELMINDLNVKFKNGEVEIEDDKIIEKLKKIKNLSLSFGVDPRKNKDGICKNCPENEIKIKELTIERDKLKAELEEVQSKTKLK